MLLLCNFVAGLHAVLEAEGADVGSGHAIRWCIVCACMPFFRVTKQGDQLMVPPQ